jgi:hypothetical protein
MPPFARIIASSAIDDVTAGETSPAFGFATDARGSRSPVARPTDDRLVLRIVGPVKKSNGRSDAHERSAR